MTDTQLAPIPDGTRTEKMAWLAQRYMRNANDEAFGDLLPDILVTGNDGELRAEAVRDPLNGETGGILVIGRSGAGKSTLVHHALGKVSCLTRATEESPGNYLYLKVPPEATEKSLAHGLLTQTGFPPAIGLKTSEAMKMFRHRVVETSICALMIDEVHHLFARGPKTTAASLLMLKDAMQGPGGVALIMAGVEKAANALALDEETERRCIQFRLCRIEANGPEANRLDTFTRLCCQYLGVVPPEDPYFGQRLIMASEGEMGRSIKLMKEMLRRVVVDGAPELSIARAARHFERCHGPSGKHPFSAGDWKDLRGTLIQMGWNA